MRVSSTNESAGVHGGVQVGDGFTIQQWMLLGFAFFLGIASVMTIDKIFLSNSGHTGAAHAGVVLENGVDSKVDK
ncbi:MAG: hypothetical protein LBP59_19630 [Planctomycetaceae bacterium]|jgi:hypothetical protein|nr:hypothetical protein [Planctomycetaceae bacterium]